MTNAVRAAISGFGAHVPTKVLSNADLEKMIDTNDEWIIQRTGISERRIAGEGESTASMAVDAARKACENAGMDPADVELIIVATMSPEMVVPSTACFVQQGLGAVKAAAFDISAACSGFIYALTIARRMIETGQFSNALVIGAEALSRFTDYTDRGSCILFGDGAGAVVLKASQGDAGVLYTTIHSDGTGWDYIHIPGGGGRHPATHETVDARLHYVKMRGREVYKFAIEKMQWLLDDCMKACHLGVDDVTMVVPHQVNIRIIESATQKLGFPREKVFVNIAKYGNTSAASIPIALEEAVRGGKIGKGSTIILVGFGAGLTWAGAVVKL
jgi:3-oxoacyl-[acyl-carrier-protein] synthase III